MQTQAIFLFTMTTLTQTLASPGLSNVLIPSSTSTPVRPLSIYTVCSAWHITISGLWPYTGTAFILISAQTTVTKSISISGITMTCIASYCVSARSACMALMHASCTLVNVITSNTITREASVAHTAIFTNQISACGIAMTPSFKGADQTLVDIWKSKSERKVVKFLWFT